MTYRFEAHGLFAAVRWPAASVALGLLVSGCSTSSSIDDLAPQPVAAQTLPAPVQPDAAAVTATEPAVTEQAMLPAERRTSPPPVGSVVNTGEFPDLNVTPGAAAEQITPEEKAAALSALKARQQRQQAAAERVRPPDEQERLRQLGQNHGADALKVIEGTQ